MSERLTIDFTPAEGAVIRIVGLIERRGYQVRGLTMTEQDASASLIVDVEPRDAGRRLSVVAQHVGKLIDVHNVQFQAVEAA